MRSVECFDTSREYSYIVERALKAKWKVAGLQDRATQLMRRAQIHRLDRQRKKSREAVKSALSLFNEANKIMAELWMEDRA